MLVIVIVDGGRHDITVVGVGVDDELHN